MGASGLVSDSIKNDCATTYTTSCAYFSLLRPLALQAAVTAGATSFVVDLSVAAGDGIVFDRGMATEERAIVASVTGAGPYTVTPVSALTKAHTLTGSNQGMQSHEPLAGATVHEVVGVTRVAASWSSASGGVVTASPAGITVPANATFGSVASFSAVTAGTYKDSSAVPPQAAGSGGGTYVPVWLEQFT